ALRLLESCPEVARRTAEPHVAALRTLLPELADAFGGANSGTEPVDPSERRARGHTALREWFLAVARERTLLVCVDNVHAADEDSAACTLSTHTSSVRSRATAKNHSRRAV